MATFDFAATAELFPGKRRFPPRSYFRYRRFTRAADAIRFAVEELPPDLLAGASIRVGDDRLDRRGIRRLYDSAEYPLPRRHSILDGPK